MLGTVVEESIHLRQKPQVSDGLFSGVRLRPVWSGVAIDPIELPIGRYIVGSDPNCDVALAMSGVEERHCLIIVGRKRVLLQSYSRLSWINEGAVSEGELRDGDRLVIGPLEFEVTFLRESFENRQRMNQYSPPDINELLHSSSSFKSNRSTVRSTPREAFLEEMLHDVQSLMDDLIDRENSSREEFEKINSALADAQFELDQEIGFLNIQQADLATSQQEFARQQQLLPNIENAKSELAQLKTELENRAAQVAQQSADLKPMRENLLEKAAQVGEELKQVRITRQQLEEARAKHEQAIISAEFLETRRREIEDSQASLDAQFKEFELLTAEIERRQIELNAQGVELEQQAEYLNIQSEEITGREAGIAVLENECDHKVAELGARQKACEDAEADFRQRRSEMDQQLAGLEKLQGELNAQQGVLKQERDDNLTLKSKHEEEFAEIKRLEVEVEERRSALDLSQIELESFEAELADRETRLLSEVEEAKRRADEFSVAESKFQEHQRTELAKLESDQLEIAKQQEELRLQAASLATDELEIQQKELDLENRSAEFHLWIRDLENEKGELKLQSELFRNKSHEIDEQAQELDKNKSELQQRFVELESELENLRLKESEINLEADAIKIWTEQIDAQRSEVSAQFNQLEIERRELDAERTRFAMQNELDQANIVEQEAVLQNLEDELNERAAELDRKLSIIDSEKGNLCEHEDALNARRRELQQEELRLKGLQDELADTSKELTEQARTFELKRVELEKRVDAVRLREEKLRSDRQQLQNKEAEFAKQTADDEESRQAQQVELESRSENLTRELEELSFQRTELDVRRNQFESEEEQLRNLESELSQREDEIAVETSRLSSKEQDLNGRLAGVEKSEAELASKQEILEADRKELDRKSEELEQLQDSIADYEIDLRASHEKLVNEERKNLRTLQDENAELVQDLQRRTAEFEAKKAEVSDAQAQLAEQQAEIRTQTERMELDRQQLESEKLQFDSASEALKSQEQKLREREVELESLKISLENQQRDLLSAAAEQDGRAAQIADFESEEQRLLALDREVRERTTQLEKWQKEIEDRDRIRVHEAAEELELQQAAIHKRERELAEREQKLNSRESEFFARSEGLESELRAQIQFVTDELSRASAERDELLNSNSNHELDSDLSIQNEELQRNQNELQQKIETLEGELRQHQDDRAEYDELKKEIATDRDRLDQLEFEFKERSAKLDSEIQKIEAEKIALAEERVEIETQRDEFNRLCEELTPVAVENSLSQQSDSGEEVVSEDHEQLVEDGAISSMLVFGSTLSNSVDGQAGDVSIVAESIDADVAEVPGDATSTKQEDTAPGALRNELASIFGIGVTEENRAPTSTGCESDCVQQEDGEDVAQPQETAVDQSEVVDQSENDRGTADAPSGKSNADAEFDFSEGGDNAVQRYMEQLLARTRGNREVRQEENDSSKQAEQEEIEQETFEDVVAEEAAKVVTNEPEVVGKSDAELVPAKPVAPKRKPQSRENVRENMNSFRKVANTSARSALAKSTLVRQRLVFQTFTVFTCISLVTTVVFSIIDWCSDANLKEFSIASGMISAVLCVYLAYCLSRIKHLETIEKATLDSNEKKS